jgi:crotonobetainyl-CoA:carnitine CoA-transferase CaiB-like acyl-CoA transferase
MRLGEVANAEAAAYGKPLDGVRVLAAEQMQSLPFATQLLARLGADVVKVENPGGGESGRGALPAMTDRTGRRTGATFLRTNLGKRSIAIDLKQPRGRELFLTLVPSFDVVAENFRAGTMQRLGLAYVDCAAAHPAVIYVSVSGFGSVSPYDTWAAYAAIVEAMSGVYDWTQPTHEPPRVNPAGPLGDNAGALFATIGVLAALRHRDRTGIGQHVDVAMLDSMIAMTDTVPSMWSMGVSPPHGRGPMLIVDGFRATDGWFVVQVGREHQFERLATLIGHPEWLDDDRLRTRAGWREHLDEVIRPGIEAWAKGRTKLEAAQAMNAEGVAAGPVNDAEDVVRDPHVRARRMLVEVERPDGFEQPFLVPGNPVKLSKATEGPETRWPSIGEHTDEVLREELGIDDAGLARLRADGVIG